MPRRPTIDAAQAGSPESYGHPDFTDGIEPRVEEIEVFGDSTDDSSAPGRSAIRQSLDGAKLADHGGVGASGHDAAEDHVLFPGQTTPGSPAVFGEQL